ncbi:hypothetical protein AGMMS50262_02970 [Bacteroidia bacterium]|nr:hypothetical protein AGMMS50262_02970 [Bacteroidia bacterium]
MKTTTILAIMLLISRISFAQIPSYFFEDKSAFDFFPALQQTDAKSVSISTKIMSMFDVSALLKEDMENAALGDIPFRFGYGFDVDYSLIDGTWQIQGKNRIWRMKFSSPGAYSFNFIFSELELIHGAELYVFNLDGGMVYGAVTEVQNISKEHDHFLTDLVAGSEVIIQLSEPIIAKDTSKLRISRVVHAYVDLFSSYNSEQGVDVPLKAATYSCHNDVACYPAWETESNGVARILVKGGTALCSGCLLNNTAQDNKPFFLTAFHCIDSNSPFGTLSVAEKNDAQTWAFRFKYKKIACNGNTVSSYITYNYANFKAAWQSTDFALVELINPITHHDAMFLGWDRSGSIPTSGIGIHHPAGDVMKISFDNNNLTSNSGSVKWTDNTQSPANSHWTVDYDNGSMEGGSSGSPLFDVNHRVVGQLHGGKAGCDTPYGRYGKFNLSWNGGGTNDTRLSNWLAPSGTIPQTLNGKIALTISGPSSACPGSNVSYTVSNPPASYTWGHSSGLTLVSTSGNTATYTVNGNGPAWVSIVANGTELIRKITNIPISVSISGPSYIALSSFGLYTTSLSGICSSYNATREWWLREVNGTATKTGTGPNISLQAVNSNIALVSKNSISEDTSIVQIPINGKNYYLEALLSTGNSSEMRISIPSNAMLVALSIDAAPATNSLSYIHYYPNPTGDILNVEIDKEAYSKLKAIFDIRLYDNQGNLLRNNTSKGEKTVFNVSNLPNGIYYIHVYDGSGNPSAG